jgi:RNA polymerase sigma factor (sigma-70 family)
MADLATGSVGRQIESLFDGSAVAGLTDGQLLERFTCGRDTGAELAFRALVTRHGPMVQGICRQILGDRHHAEDAFQAVFLVLAIKARSIRDPDLVGTWLFGVALRTAQRTKARLGRERRDEGNDSVRGLVADRMSDAAVPPADHSAMAREHAEILHDEIERLPRTFRLPVILCYFEGLTLAEAARSLRCPAGTLHSRLARAREKLRSRLTRRGLVLTASACGVALSDRSASAFVTPAVCEKTCRAAMQLAAGQAASTLAASLAREALRRMSASQLRLIATTVLFVVAGALSAGYFTLSLASQDEPKRLPVDVRPHGAARANETNPQPAPSRMFVVGRVLDPQGKPVPNATTMVYAAPKQPGSGGGGLRDKLRPSAIGQARSDELGRFQVDVPRTSSSRHRQMGAVAIAPGYGAGWIELDPDAERPDADIALCPEQVIEGRLFDVIGRQVQGVEVKVQAIGRVIDGKLSGQYGDGPRFWWNPGDDLPAWPKSARSDSEGKFTIRNVGRGLRVVLIVDDPRFARQVVPIDTVGPLQSQPVTVALMPAKIIKGRVTEGDTGNPIPHAQINILSYASSTVGTVNEFEADDLGLFRANPLSAERYEVSVTAPEEQPRLGVSKLFDWPKGAVEYPVDVALPRGVVIRGKLTEEVSGKPVAGARISFGTRRSVEAQAGAVNGRAISASDGSFQMAVLPSPGFLVVLGPSEDYVLREIDGGMVREGKSGGRAFYAHAFRFCDLKPADASPVVNVTLRRGRTVSGRVVGPEGEAIQNAWMISRVCLSPQVSAWFSWRAHYHGSVKNGRFEIHGLDSDAAVPVYFLEPHQKFGATAFFTGKATDSEPIKVRLEICGTAKARLVDASGKPVAGYAGRRLISLGIIPPHVFRHSEASLALIDSINYADGPVSDALGRITFPALIPGAPYHFSTNGRATAQGDQDFTVKPGETLDLGEIVIARSVPTS